MLLMALCIRVGQPHEDHDLATGITGAGGPPLATVDNPLVALAAGVGLHVGGVRRGHSRLGHAEAGANLTLQQRLEPLILLLLRTVARSEERRVGKECKYRRSPDHAKT